MPGTQIRTAVVNGARRTKLFSNAMGPQDLHTALRNAKVLLRGTSQLSADTAAVAPDADPDGLATRPCTPQCTPQCTPPSDVAPLAFGTMGTFSLRFVYFVFVT